MLIPEYLNKDDYIGVTACSCGVLDKIEKYEKSLNAFKENGFQIVETSNVRTGGVVSSDAKTRACELESLFLDKKIKLVSIARGGDFLSDMLSEVNFELLASNPKWLVGSSDPTSLLYILTTNYDIATIYSPCNMTGFDLTPLHESYLNYFEIIKGNLIKQCKFDMCEKNAFSDVLDEPNEWLNVNGDVNEQGILIGGCIDVLKDIIGTKFDKTNEFLEKYKDDGFIWYFDIFSLTSESLYNTLIQFKNAGWFKYTKAILFSKVAFPNSFVDMTYEELIKKALLDIKVIYKFDVGHVHPSFTMINGLKVQVISNEKEQSLEYL